MNSPRTLAAVDLGSNSFHMVVARVEDGHVHLVDRLKERVALAAGVDSAGNLGEEAQERAIACLSRFGQRLRDVPPANVRAVGTNALRRARNASEFLARAEPALGHTIEVIPGKEEARLIYLGVARSRRQDPGTRLVVDVGGGSTEIVIGRGDEPLCADSLDMGCVTFSVRHFRRGRITRKALQRARLAARREVSPIKRRYRRLGWKVAIGSSGTVLAIDEILREAGWSKKGVTAKGLRRLRAALVAAGDVEGLDLPGMDPDRAPVLAGGVAILSGVFDELKIDVMVPSSGALREGVLHDLLGRFGREDVRDRTVQRMMRRHRVDLAQARRVERTALRLVVPVAGAWKLDEDAKKLLSWAARLHEIGLSVAYSGHHRHGAYLAANSDMPGFSRDDQQALAALLLGHRRKPPPAIFAGFSAPAALRVRHLCVLLRLAVLLHRDRSPRRGPTLVLEPREDALRIQFPEGWLARHPLTRADLDEETQFLASVGVDLRVR